MQNHQGKIIPVRGHGSKILSGARFLEKSMKKRKQKLSEYIVNNFTIVQQQQKPPEKIKNGDGDEDENGDLEFLNNFIKDRELEYSGNEKKREFIRILLKIYQKLLFFCDFKISFILKKVNTIN